jgi:hypothetical protein
MKALSIRQPWAWAIVHAGKRIENRQRKDGAMPDICRHRGPLLLHASKGMARLECLEAFQDRQDMGVEMDGIWPGAKALQRGGIVGRCRAVAHLDCTGRFWFNPSSSIEANLTWRRGPSRGDSEIDMRWWAGGYALVLADVEPLPFIECKGALGLWNVSESTLAELAVHGAKIT